MAAVLAVWGFLGGSAIIRPPTVALSGVIGFCYTTPYVIFVIVTVVGSVVILA